MKKHIKHCNCETCKEYQQVLIEKATHEGIEVGKRLAKTEKVECSKGCLKHKYHCGVCNAPLTYSPANYCSRPSDIPNECTNCHKVKPEGVGEWEKGEYHATENGWCCACQYDIARLDTLLLQEKAKWKGEVIEMVKELVPNFTTFIHDLIEGIVSKFL